MSARHDPTTPPDVCLLLRADAERRWLRREVIPLLNQLEMDGCYEERRIGPGLAHLAEIWVQAMVRAGDSETAQTRLHAEALADRALSRRARSYHEEVRDLRRVLAARVTRLVCAAGAEERTPRGSREQLG